MTFIVSTYFVKNTLILLASLVEDLMIDDDSTPEARPGPYPYLT